MTNVCIVFRDEIGEISVEVDGCGVQFLDGIAYFSDATEKEYRIPMENLVAIAFI